jgi:hypothetical protein
VDMARCFSDKQHWKKRMVGVIAGVGASTLMCSLASAQTEIKRKDTERSED